MRIYAFTGWLLAALFCSGLYGDNGAEAERVEEHVMKSSMVTAYVVPIEGVIDTPQLYILRRALKQAIEENVEAVVLQMDTPGGALSVTLEMMTALDLFDGVTITYIDQEAISAGSYIAVATDDIYFAPGGMMGAAAVVTGTGEDVDATMKQKIDSVLRAKVRTLSGAHRYRADVQRAMMDANFELVIDGVTIKDKGELLTLTDVEAVKEYGDPPEPILARGIVSDVEALLNDRFGDGNWRIETFELTWSEHLAKWLRTIVPLLLGLGMLLLFIEFKTPGFGFFGIAGIALLLIVFASNYVAGLAGYEPVILFLLGLILLLVELFILPGIFIAGIAGFVCVVAALIWSLADIWPKEAAPLTVDVLLAPLGDLLFGLALAIVGGILLVRFLPQSWFWDRLVLAESVDGRQADSTATLETSTNTAARSRCAAFPVEGATGIALTALFPSGRVEIEGVRYPARSESGYIEKGEMVTVVECREATLVVRRQTK